MSRPNKTPRLLIDINVKQVEVVGENRGSISGTYANKALTALVKYDLSSQLVIIQHNSSELPSAETATRG